MGATSRIERAASCEPEDVFAVLADGWLYASWVVGASRIRAVDDAWPAVGARLHHSVGAWPVLVDDHTEVLAHDPLRSLRLRARAWPAGEARVELAVSPTIDGCTVVIEESPAAGPATLLPAPLMRAGLDLRNRETMRRLVLLAEGRRAQQR